jgi:DNA-binding SARP family transcriptional activator/tetratricopeptide (TPR) repeat protein
MEFRLLGEVRLLVGGRSLDTGTPRQQAVLAALAVDAGRPVPIETLVDRVWSDAPPHEARNILYSHLSRVRQLLRDAAAASGIPARIDRRSAGYVLEIDRDLVDLHRFARLADRGRDPRGIDADRAAALSEALGLWHGAPLSGIPGEWADQVRDSWRLRRLDAIVHWGELELSMGHADAVLGAVPDLAAEYPLAEPLEGLLMRALHAAGRDAEALDRYAALRQRLTDELGTDPAQELRALHAAILRGELPTPVAAEPAAGSPLATPAQLPPDVFGFAGRDEELRRLDGMIAGGARAVRIVAVSGTAGVGKTSLAVHWAHRVRHEFPDGQLYVNLRGFDATGSPVTPAEAIRGLIDAFDVPQQRIPAGFEAQVGLYRSLLANRRTLIVLDNARDAEQVRPLLPGAPGCLAVVTSRTMLSGLVAAGAVPLTLDLLDVGEARTLLAGRIGADRVAAEPRAVEEIVSSCARLPLALAVAAARAATHPGFTLADLAGELRAARGGLDEFSSADPATDPRAVFSWSYLQLTDDAARLFRLIGLHPGPDIGTPAAASLAAIPPARARTLLTELARAHLVAEPTPGRYTCHDLLRAYAREEAEIIEYAADRTAAVRRLLAHYIHSANHADHLLDPRREEPPTLTPLPPGVTPQLTEHPIDWFNTERPVLLAAIHQPPEFDAEVWELVWTTRRYLAHQGHWHEEIDALTVALSAARRLGDTLKQAFAHCFIGCTNVWFDQYEDARADLQAALELYRAAGNRIGEAYVQHYFCWMLDRQGRKREALVHAERALALFRSVGHQAGQAKALNAVGWFHALLGDHRAAIGYCEEALALQTELGDQVGAGQTWHSLGYVHDHLRDHSRAISCHLAAIDLFRESGYRINEAHVLISLGDTHRNAGNLKMARVTWQEAATILEQLDHPDLDQARSRLIESAHSAENYELED